MVGSLEISAIIVLVFVIGGLIYLNIKYNNLVQTSQKSLYRSFIIPDGNDGHLVAQDGYTLSIDRLYVGVGPLPSSNEQQVRDCYAGMQDLTDLSSGFPCKLPTLVYRKGQTNNLSDTISNNVEGQLTVTIPKEDVDKTITDSGKDEGCVSGTSNGGFYVFGVYECIPSV